jgi:hypothetical protein
VLQKIVTTIWLLRRRRSHSRARVWRARNPESGARMGKKNEILRAAATRENDKQRIRHDQNRRYTMQDSINESDRGAIT